VPSSAAARQTIGGLCRVPQRGQSISSPGGSRRRSSSCSSSRVSGPPASASAIAARVSATASVRDRPDASSAA
jgi:hypothetical protein